MRRTKQLWSLIADPTHFSVPEPSSENTNNGECDFKLLQRVLMSTVCASVASRWASYLILRLTCPKTEDEPFKLLVSMNGSTRRLSEPFIICLPSRDVAMRAHRLKVAASSCICVQKALCPCLFLPAVPTPTSTPHTSLQYAPTGLVQTSNPRNPIESRSSG